MEHGITGLQIIESGDLFLSEAQTLVNTVNCIGVMGKGLALRFKLLYPEMYIAYRDICMQGLLDIGKLWLYRSYNKKWVLNFPTKYDWRAPSRESYIEAGLEKFIATYRKKGITSIAFPLLGAGNGLLDPKISLNIMTYYLKQCDIPVYVYVKYCSSFK